MPVFAEVGGLVVDADHRGAGAGRMLLEAAEDWAVAEGCALILIQSNVVRKNAQDFYQKSGYKILKTQNVFQKRLGDQQPLEGSFPHR